MAKREQPARSAKAVVVTVHGTGDTADRDDGPKWFQIGSPFTTQLQAILSRHGVESEIRPVLWSGANSAMEREAGAEKLEKELAKLTREYSSVHIIGHSHGGNVANDAVCRLRLPEAMRAAFAAHPLARFNPVRFFLPRAAQAPASLTTVGTPFFAAKLTASESFNPAAAMALAGLGVLGFVFLAFVLAVTFLDPQELANLGDSKVLVTTLAGALGPVLLILTGLAAWHLYRFGHAEFTRQTRLNLTETLRRNAKAAETRVHAIWHENDEAIAFLQKVETLPIEPLGKGMMMSRSRRTAIVAGIRFAIFTSFAAGVIGAILTGIDLVTKAKSDDVSSWFILLIVLLVGIGIAPLLFGLAYFANRFIFGLLPEAGRPHINRFISGAFTGMAFGRDGPEAIGKVSSRSHILETDEMVLSGAVAERMRDNAGAAAGKLIEKYRWALFTVGGDTNASLTSMSTDAMTWDSLIHTTYFDQPEVAEMIGAHIAGRHAAEIDAQPALR